MVHIVDLDCVQSVCAKGALFRVVVDPIWKPDSRRVYCSPAHEHNHSLSNNPNLGDDVVMHRIDVWLFIHWPVHEYVDKPKTRNTKEYIFGSWAPRCSRGGYLWISSVSRTGASILLNAKRRQIDDIRHLKRGTCVVTEFMRGGSHYKQTLDFAHVPIIALSRSLPWFQDGC